MPILQAIAEDAWLTIDCQAQIAEPPAAAGDRASGARAWSDRRPTRGPSGRTTRGSPTAATTTPSLRPSTAITRRRGSVVDLKGRRVGAHSLRALLRRRSVDRAARNLVAGHAHRTARDDRARRPHPTSSAAEYPRGPDRHARGSTLHLPAAGPWHGDDISARNCIRALPPPTGRPPGRHQQPKLSFTPAGRTQGCPKTPQRSHGHAPSPDRYSPTRPV